MTNCEILEAEKLIASMRDFLSLIASERDEYKLTATVLENYEPVSLYALRIGVAAGEMGLESKLNASLFEIDRRLSRIYALAIWVRRRPKPEQIESYRKRLADSVEQDVPVIKAALDQIAQALSEKAAGPK